MDFHHDTSFRSILEDNPFLQHLKLAFVLVRTRGHDYGWLVIRPSIHPFCITHFTFTLVLRFHFGLIQPSTFNLLICEGGHGLDTFDMYLIHCPFGG